MWATRSVGNVVYSGKQNEGLSCLSGTYCLGAEIDNKQKNLGPLHITTNDDGAIEGNGPKRKRWEH